MRIISEFKSVNEYLEFKEKTAQEQHINIKSITSKVEHQKVEEQILKILRKENISAKEILENLNDCKLYILCNMPTEKDLNDEFTW